MQGSQLQSGRTGRSMCVGSASQDSPLLTSRSPAQRHTLPLADHGSVFTQSVAPKPRAKPLHLKSPYSRISEHVRREPARFTFRFYFWFAARRQLNERLRSFFKWPAQTSGLFLPCCLYRHFTNIYHYLPQGALSSVIFEITKPLRCGPFKRFPVKLHH